MIIETVIINIIISIMMIQYCIIINMIQCIIHKISSSCSILFHWQTFFEEFESPCDHGFFNRGDLEDPAVAECVQRAMDLTINFLTQYVVNN